MAAPKAESYPDLSPLLLCTGCGKLVAVVVTIEDRRGGASICEQCLAQANDVLATFLDEGADGGVSGDVADSPDEVVESC